MSPNSIGMIVVIAQLPRIRFGEARNSPFGLKRVTRTHFSENMAHLIIPIVKYDELQDRLGYFVLDYINSNDTCVSEILRNLQP
jgi:hypothetical protein